MNRQQLFNDPELVARLIQEDLQSRMWTALPCVVTKVNFDKMTIECRPTIKGVITDENGVTSYVNMPLLLDVPICFPSAGGFLLTLPIAVDDEVLCVFSCRAIDSWWQSGGIGIPVESRMHDLSDAFAIPGPRSVPNVAGSISQTGAQLRNDAGTTYIEIAADGKIKLVSPSTVAVTGNLTVSGTVVAQGEITSITTPLHTHVHTSAAPGSPTSAPIP